MRLPLLSLLGVLAMGACVSFEAVGPSEHAHAATQAVEVRNLTSHSIMIKYTTRHGGPYTLGEVGSTQTHTFSLPHSDVLHVYPETTTGRRLDRESRSAVYIRLIHRDQEGTSGVLQ